MYHICKDIKKCDNATEPPKDKKDQPLGGFQQGEFIPHGGCGQDQPKISREGLTLKVKFDAKAGEQGIDTGGELTPSKVVHSSFSLLSNVRRSTFSNKFRRKIAFLWVSILPTVDLTG